MSDPIRIGVHGVGSVGKHVAKPLLEHRHGMEVVAATTQEAADVGRPLHEVAGADAEGGPTILRTLDDLLAARPDVVVLSTGSFLPDVAEDVTALLNAGVRVVSPCEELAFPRAGIPTWLALWTRPPARTTPRCSAPGSRPAFSSTAFSAASAAHAGTSTRSGVVVSWTYPVRQNIHLRLGIGYTPEEFDQGHRDGTIAGHVGFPETIEMVVRRMGLTLDEPVKQIFVPMIAETPAPARYGHVEIGKTEGFIHRGIGRVGGDDFIQFELLLHLRPEGAGYKATDTLELDGVHPVKMTLDPGMDPLLATAAMLVNSIRALMSAPPG